MDSMYFNLLKEITREENNVSELKKQPLGLEPRWIHDSKRASDILDAIERYTDANMSIPKKWVEELKDLFNNYFGE